MASEYLGYVLIAIGITLFVFTFVLGYNVYLGQASSSQAGSAPSVSGGSINETLKSGMQGIVSSLNSAIYETLSVMVLFLFASIAYKLTDLGIKMTGSGKERGR
jgi:hypothetical protein